MPMHVVQDTTAQAGQQPEAQAKAENKNAGLFWFIAGGLAGAVAMHITARKMQEYAGGMYTARARLQSRLNPDATMNDAMRMRAAEEVDAEDDSWF